MGAALSRDPHPHAAPPLITRGVAAYPRCRRHAAALPLRESPPLATDNAAARRLHQAPSLRCNPSPG